MALSTSALLIGGVIAGGVTKIYGNIKANAAQAQAEQANASFYKEQAEFAEAATARSLEIFGDEAETFRGQQVSAIAAGGLQLSGSPLLLLADTAMKKYKEEASIKEDGRMKAREAYLKAGASMEQAERLTSFSNNALPALGTAIDVGTRIYGMGKK